MNEQDEVQGHSAARVAWGQPLPVCPVSFSLELSAMASASDLAQGVLASPVQVGLCLS